MDISNLPPLNEEEFSLASQGKEGIAVMKYVSRTRKTNAQAQEVVRRRMESVSGLSDMFKWSF